MTHSETPNSAHTATAVEGRGMSKRDNGRPYRRLRDRVKRDQPLCPHCDARGLTVTGAEVDHILPLSQGGAPRDRANLQHLCAACHDAKTQQQQGGIESTGGRPHGHRTPPNVRSRNHWRRLRNRWRAFVAELA